MANIVYLPDYHRKCRYVINEWRKNVGDKIIGGAVLLSYKSDDGLLYKCSSNASGIILKRFYPVGSSVPEGIPVCIVGQPNENVTELIRYAESIIAKKDKTSQFQHLEGILSEQEKNTYRNTSTGSGNPECDVSNSDSIFAEIANIRRKLSKINDDIAQYRQLNQPVSEKAPFVITFTGRFKTGKSSLINALLGAEILPTRATTATAVVTRIFNGKKTQAYLSEYGKTTPITIEQAQDIILNYKVKDVNHLAEIIFELPIPWLGNDVEIRDTPGMDDGAQDGALEDSAMNSLSDTDLCICVYDAGAFPSGKERERTKRICEMLDGNVVYVINCINHLNSLDGLNLVEESAKALFGTMTYKLPEMGKYWCICSAPGNLYLDEFDIWFKRFVSSKDSGLKSNIRSISAKSQLRTKCNEYINEIIGLSVSVTERKNTVAKLHTKSLAEQQEKIRKAIKEKTDRLKSIKYSLEQKLVDISSLESKLSSTFESTKQMNEYNNDYAKMSCAVTANYFRYKYTDLCGKYPEYLRRTDSTDIWHSVDNIQFPAKHAINVSATGKEKAGWAAAGAVIGSLFAPGIGTAIGAAIGGAVGSVDTTQDDSVSNTMSFVRSTVIPAVRGAFETIIQNNINNLNKKCNEQCKQLKSGYEDKLSKIDKTLADCNDTQKYLKQLFEN